MTDLASAGFVVSGEWPLSVLTLVRFLSFPEPRRLPIPRLATRTSMTLLVL